MTIPRFGCWYCYASLLAKYPGLGSIFQAAYHQEQTAGGSVHFMSEKIDEGDILVQSRVSIRPSDSVSRAHFKVYLASAPLLLEVVDMIMNQRIRFIPKNGTESSYYSRPKKEDIVKFK